MLTVFTVKANVLSFFPRRREKEPAFVRIFNSLKVFSITDSTENFSVCQPKTGNYFPKTAISKKFSIPHKNTHPVFDNLTKVFSQS